MYNLLDSKIEGQTISFNYVIINLTIINKYFRHILIGN